jgi:hypothetical protein
MPHISKKDFRALQAFVSGDDQDTFVGQPTGPTRKRLTFNYVTAVLREHGIQETLVQGEGYLYFVDGEAFSWYSQSIPVCRLNHTTMESILATHKDLSAVGFGRVPRVNKNYAIIALQREYDIVNDAACDAACQPHRAKLMRQLNVLRKKIAVLKKST